MIMRLFLIFGLILLGGTGYFIVVQTPPTVQAAPAVAEIDRLREEGIIPEGVMAENEEIEHDIFGVPPEDEAMIEAAMENMDMGDMDMGSMDMNADGGMDMNADAEMDMADDAGMDMDADNGMDMAGDAGMDMAADGEMDMADDGGMDMAADGGMDMADDAGMDMDAGGGMDMAAEDEMDEEEAERLMAGQMAGLIVTDEGDFDREIALSMTEWTFSDLEIDAQPGERIRFTLRNDGAIVHEFMFMGMAQMQGVNYRARRADWNLVEHEALYEKSLLLPGEELTFVANVVRPGVWMFMCMLPYHMQMGMMGQLATEGMAMEM
ncbi:multicopper oxidase domain-containing protein [Yoonia sp.]|uniref:multicopper oxidase domain-containing protein n=1 Tax=Yoonia sp. TaxID=2212373 RepID=UPI0023B51C9E